MTIVLVGITRCGTCGGLTLLTCRNMREAWCAERPAAQILEVAVLARQFANLARNGAGR